MMASLLDIINLINEQIKNKGPTYSTIEEEETHKQRWYEKELITLLLYHHYIISLLKLLFSFFSI